jgi:spoIIIJ-associated protein
LQFLVNLVLSRGEGHASGIVVDVEQYRGRRQRQVSTLAERMAQHAVSNGASVTLDPMSAADRRIVHVTLADYAGVATESSGEGRERRVTITSTGEVDPSSVGARRRGSRGNRRPRSES